MRRRKPTPKFTNWKKKESLKDKLRKKHALKGGEKTICLTMIVKNESANMVRLLDSVKPAIDMICITDTGSTDNTVEIIHEWGKTNGIETTVCHDEWKNFSYNRTNSVRNAKKTYPNADYFLLSDADFVWEVNVGGKFDKRLLVDHKYMIRQHNPSISYDNVRLLSSQVDWECVGLTHEYWAEALKQEGFSGYVRTARIRTLQIDDREDGGCKDDKFERDERLLRYGLTIPEERPGLHTRYKFYLAQTLKDTGRHFEAIEQYKERIKDKGFEEEVYYSRFQIGFCLEKIAWNYNYCADIMLKAAESDGKEDPNLGEDGEGGPEREPKYTEKQLELLEKWNPDDDPPGQLKLKADYYFEQADKAYWKAYQSRKHRAEALYNLTRMHRTLFHSARAYELTQIGRKIERTTDTLFVNDAAYDYLWDFEISLTAFYLYGKMDEARNAISKLMVRNDIPKYIRDTIERNAKYYL